MKYTGMKALVMGLGLHGGGLESVRFLLKRGALVSVTDLRDEKTLSPSIEQLDKICSELGSSPVRYILGKHETDDFKNADIVIKNPGVRPDSPFLQASKKIETDLSLFLNESPARLFAVSGTKGKSGTASALHWILASKRKSGRAYLGGNITVSPLTFLDELSKDDDVVLELSSFQLGDIKTIGCGELLKPKAAILTSIMHDHLDRYASMDEYIDDKRNIYRAQDEACVTIAGDDDWGKSFLAQTKARQIIWSGKQGLRSPLAEGQSGGWIDNEGRGVAQLYNFEDISEELTELVPQKLLTPGSHQKLNMLSAALAAYALGAQAQTIRGALAEFKGIEHRLEFFHEANGVRFYNDSAATIPEAAAACIEALTENASFVLVTGGTDKNLDFSPLASAAKKAKAIVLIAGTGSEKLSKLLAENGLSAEGPFDDLDKAVSCAVKKAEESKCGEDACCVALSPGCASFGMFLNEFYRGRKWKEAVERLT
jgi:UDP-N-acetylmuramoylalanine--D-glutamate ligase